MAKAKKETAAEQATEAPMGDEVKVKEKPQPKKMKNLGKQDETFKVNLNEPREEKEVEESKDTQPENVQPEENTDDKVIEEIQEKVEEKKVEEKKEETEKPVLEEITEEKTNEVVENKVEEVKETVEEAVKESKETGKKLPENIQKVVDFMNETGGDLEDYVKLNQDYSKYDDMSILHEYYRQTKPHLTQDERNFLIEDSFSFDEEVDEEKDVKRKKLAFKEQVANAKNHMDGLKTQYYKEIKSGAKLAPEQQKAIDFYNTYTSEQEEASKIAEKQKSNFLNKTNEVFSSEFKGFEFNVGDKKYRYNVKDVNAIKNSQSDINNFIKKYVDKDNMISDANGYHKSLFTAMNADAIANHFYEQGKADAIQSSMKNTKNIDMAPRQGHENVQESGLKFKVVDDNAASKLRFKIKN